MKGIKNRIALNLLVIVIAVIYAGILILSNVGKVSSNVAVVPGSYGEKYAKENHLNLVEIADSEKHYFDIKYETFDYTVEDNNRITLENYLGTSSDLVIPAFIDGKTVTALSENFMSTLSTVKNIYVSNAIKEIHGDPVKSITIHCFKDNAFYLDNQEADWNFDFIYDSDYINFDLGDIPFRYNVQGNSVEITGYTGDENYIIIPAYINGMPVTQVSMDMLGAVGIIVIPETVIMISGVSAMIIYFPLFAVELVFSLLAFVFALITINILLPRYKKSNAEYQITGNQVVTLVLYVICQTGFSIYAIYFGKISLFIAIVVSAVIMIAFLCTEFLGGIGRQHATDVEEKREQKTYRMDALKVSVKYLADGVQDVELKKKVQRLVDEIRYSDPISTKELDELETALENKTAELKQEISSGNTETVSHIADEMMEMLRDRNARLKSTK